MLKAEGTLICIFCGSYWRFSSRTEQDRLIQVILYPFIIEFGLLWVPQQNNLWVLVR